MPEFHPLGRELTVKPRRTGYKHRPIITVVDGVGMTEEGEAIHNLPLFATSIGEPYIWCAYDALSILQPMADWFSGVDWFTWTFTDSRDLEVPDGYMAKPRLATFGFHKRAESAGFRRMGRHMVWEPSRMFSDPSLAAAFLRNTHGDLLSFAQDVRDWCRTQDLQIRGTLPSLAAQLLRDGRFWPSARGRVPRATNEATRRALPGVYHRRLAPLHTRIPAAVGLDQARAYHRAAQQVPTPDPTTLFARGYFNEPDSGRVWAAAGSPTYDRTMSQPGVVAVLATARPARKGEFRLPAVDRVKGKEAVIYLWTNEVSYAVRTGLRITGIVAAWTSVEVDRGLPLYGAFAESAIDGASELRRAWLKPTLHAAYGLLGSRQRSLFTLSRYGHGMDAVVLLQGYPFPVVQSMPREGASPVTNVPMLGTLQAEIRRRSLEVAADMRARGVEVLHVHADGIHVRAGALPFPPEGWTMEPVSNLTYEDDVSWLSDERDVLPGRDTRARVQVRRHNAKLVRRHADQGPQRSRRGQATHA